MKKKHVLYFNPDETKLNFEKPFEMKNLPGKVCKYGRCKMTVEKYVPLKSLKQLGYLFGGVLPFMEKSMYDDTGMSNDDWKMELKDRFGIKESDLSGNFIRQKSFSKYSEKEMAFFITQVINWVRDFFNVQIPPPTVIEEYI